MTEPTTLNVFASIPSPSSNSIDIGPLELRAYGLAIAIGVLAAVELARRRWIARGGDPEDISVIALWAVPAGLVGARLYHVATDWRRFTEGRWLDAFKIWEGGLGIPGGIALGVIVGVIVANRRGLSMASAVDTVAPALPLAQAIGRLGNWFNQELFGRPTDLPWALEIDPSHRPSEYADSATFHPTFLYEALWNLALVGVLLAVERRVKLRPGSLLAIYVAGYALGRFWVELVRVDEASLILGVRVNVWMSALAFGAAVAWLLWASTRDRPDRSEQANVPDGDPVERGPE